MDVLTLEDLADIHDILAYCKGMGVPVLPHLDERYRNERLEALCAVTHRLAKIPDC